MTILYIYLIGIICAYFIVSSDMKNLPKWQQVWYSVVWPVTLLLYLIHVIYSE